MQHPIKDYKDLRVWQSGHQLAILTYRITENLPSKEQFGLTNQMRRAAVSVTANIAEGFGRNTNKDREHFYTMAYGSLMELSSHYQLALDLNYINDDSYKQAGGLLT